MLTVDSPGSSSGPSPDQTRALNALAKAVTVTAARVRDGSMPLPHPQSGPASVPPMQQANFARVQVEANEYHQHHNHLHQSVTLSADPQVIAEATAAVQHAQRAEADAIFQAEYSQAETHHVRGEAEEYGSAVYAQASVAVANAEATIQAQARDALAHAEESLRTSIVQECEERFSAHQAKAAHVHQAQQQEIQRLTTENSTIRNNFQHLQAVAIATQEEFTKSQNAPVYTTPGDTRTAQPSAERVKPPRESQRRLFDNDTPPQQRQARKQSREDRRQQSQARSSKDSAPPTAGSKAVAASAPDQWPCPNCNGPTSSIFVFCPHCGEPNQKFTKFGLKNRRKDKHESKKEKKQAFTEHRPASAKRTQHFDVSTPQVSPPEKTPAFTILTSKDAKQRKK